MGKRFRKDRFSKSWWAPRGYWYRRPERGGVIGNSRIVPGRFHDEGDNGPAHRREIKRREERLWRKEIEMRHELNDPGIVYAHVGIGTAMSRRAVSVWHVEYESGWARRSVMDYRGSVMYTRWIPPGRVM